MFIQNTDEGLAIKEMSNWAVERGLLSDWVDKDVLCDPIANAAKLFATEKPVGVLVEEYREFIRDFQGIVTKPDFRMPISLKDQWTDNYSWLRHITKQNSSFGLQFNIGRANWNFWNGSRRVSKQIPVLKIYGVRGVEMWLTNFEEKENKPNTHDTEIAIFPRLKILLIQSDEQSTKKTWAVYRFLKDVYDYLICECGIHLLFGSAITMESDIPQATEWRTKNAGTIKFKTIDYTVSRLEKYWITSGHFYALPNLYGNPKKLMLVMMSEGFKTKLLQTESEWQTFIDWCDQHARSHSNK